MNRMIGLGIAVTLVIVLRSESSALQTLQNYICAQRENTLICGSQETAPCDTTFGAVCTRCDAQPVSGFSYQCRPSLEHECTPVTPYDSTDCGTKWTGYCVDPGPGGTWTCQEVADGDCDKAWNSCNP